MKLIRCLRSLAATLAALRSMSRIPFVPFLILVRTLFNGRQEVNVRYLDLSPFCPFNPLQGPRLKIQFAFCFGIRYASHLSAVVNRIRTTIAFQGVLN